MARSKALPVLVYSFVILTSCVLLAFFSCVAEGAESAPECRPNPARCTNISDCLGFAEQAKLDRFVGDVACKGSLQDSLPYFKHVCDQNGSVGCLRYGYAARDYDSSRAYYKKACDLGNSMGCLLHEYQWDESRSFRDNPDLQAIFRKQCASGIARGCMYLAMVIQAEDSRNFPPHYDRFRPSLKKACELGLAEACHDLGRTFFNDTAGCENPDCEYKDQKTAIRYFGLACDKGHEEACGILGHVLIDPEEPVHNFSRGVSIMERLCAKKGGVYCAELGDIYAQGKIVKKDPARAAGLFDRACKTGFANSCGRR
ncbi:MAG: tetratricopeptide repeat protein [Myxococcota bacterium]